MLRFGKACQVPRQQLARQATIEAHFSSVPCALLLMLAGLRGGLFAQPCFLMRVIQVSVAPALIPDGCPHSRTGLALSQEKANRILPYRGH